MCLMMYKLKVLSKKKKRKRKNKNQEENQNIKKGSYEKIGQKLK